MANCARLQVQHVEMSPDEYEDDNQIYRQGSISSGCMLGNCDETVVQYAHLTWDIAEMEDPHLSTFRLMAMG